MGEVETSHLYVETNVQEKTVRDFTGGLSKIEGLLFTYKLLLESESLFII